MKTATTTEGDKQLDSIIGRLSRSQRECVLKPNKQWPKFYSSKTIERVVEEKLVERVSVSFRHTPLGERVRRRIIEAKWPLH